MDRIMKRILIFCNHHRILVVMSYCILYTIMGYFLIKKGNLSNVDTIMHELDQGNANAANIAKVIGTLLGMIIVFFTPIFMILYLSFLYWVSSSFLSFHFTYNEIVKAMSEKYIIILLFEIANFILIVLFNQKPLILSEVLHLHNIYLRLIFDNIGLATTITLFFVGIMLKIESRFKNAQQVLMTTTLGIIFVAIFQVTQ